MAIPSRYPVAIHTLILLEQNPDLSSAEIAASVGTNPVIIRTLFRRLKKAGLIEIRKGIRGARLTRPAKTITLLDIYLATETENALFQIHERPNPKCPVGRGIQHSLDEILGRAEQAMGKELGRHTLAGLSRQVIRDS